MIYTNSKSRIAPTIYIKMNGRRPWSTTRGKWNQTHGLAPHLAKGWEEENKSKESTPSLIIPSMVYAIVAVDAKCGISHKSNKQNEQPPLIFNLID